MVQPGRQWSEHDAEVHNDVADTPLGRDGNPLRRREDLVAGWLLPAWFLAFLALAPLVAAGAGLWVRSGNSSVINAERSWHKLQGVLLRAAPGPEMTDGGANTWTVWTLARWTADGLQHVGAVPAAAKSSAGSEVAVWLDKAGNVEVPPLPSAQLSAYADTAMVIAMAGLAVFLAGLALIASRILDKRRLASWESAWLTTGPRWSGQN